MCLIMSITSFLVSWICIEHEIVRIVANFTEGVSLNVVEIVILIETVGVIVLTKRIRRVEPFLVEALWLKL